MKVKEYPAVQIISQGRMCCKFNGVDLSKEEDERGSEE